MKSLFWGAGLASCCAILALSSCAVQDEKGPPKGVSGKAEPAAKAPEAKAKPLNVSGDIGLLDLEKNYAIVVTKEGKLVTVEFDDKTKVTQYVTQQAKMSDVDLGTSATITYKRKVIELESVEYKEKAKKGD